MNQGYKSVKDYHKEMKIWCKPRGHTTHTQRHQIPEKPIKSGLIEVWHKDNLYLRTNTIRNGNPPTQWILIREREVLGWHHEASCSSISSFLFFREPRKGDYPTNTQVWQRSLFIWKLRNLTCLVMPLFILTRLKKTLIDPP